MEADMRALPRCFLALVVTAVFVSGAYSQTPPPTQAKPGAPQAPARDTKAPKAATGVIRGRVVAADNGAPLRRARLVLSAPGQQKTSSATADLQGRYEFTELPAGRYTLIASKTSYVTLQYGQRRAFESGKPIELADAATLEKVDFVLPRGGVISGAVVDDLGEPVAGVRVTAMRSRYDGGKRKLAPTGRAAETNDLGQYRIYGLQPGTYFVATLPISGPLAMILAGGALDPSALEAGVQFPSAYYPGTLNAAEAQHVTVRMAQERAGTDFVQLPGRLVRVSGTVVDPQGRSQAPMMVMLMSTTSIGNMMNGTVKPDGSFTIPNVAPGEYALGATMTDPATSQMQSTTLMLTVTGDDVNVTIPMSSGARVAGRVVTEDGSVPSFPPKGVLVMPKMVQSDVPFRLGGNIATFGALGDDWSFEWKGLGGTLLFRPSGLPAGYMLKSVLLDGRDITDTPLDIKGTEEVSGLQVVITGGITEISGAPTNAKGQPALDYSVVVFAEDAARWKYPSRFLATARPDLQGHFKIANLPPGRYLAVALEYLEEGQSEDPEFLEALRPLATRFTLAEGETKTLDLKVTKADGT
jgi:hypothetical protein